MGRLPDPRLDPSPLGVTVRDVLLGVAWPLLLLLVGRPARLPRGVPERERDLSEMETGAAEPRLDLVPGRSPGSRLGDKPGEPYCWIPLGKVDSTGVVSCDGMRAKGEVMELM